MTTVDVKTLGDGNATVARVEVYIPGGVDVSVTGSAKKHPRDPSVEVVGEALALSRAFAAAARELEEYAAETNTRHIEHAAHEKKLDKLMNALFGDELA